MTLLDQLLRHGWSLAVALIVLAQADYQLGRLGHRVFTRHIRPPGEVEVGEADLEAGRGAVVSRKHLLGSLSGAAGLTLMWLSPTGDPEWDAGLFEFAAGAAVLPLVTGLLRHAAVISVARVQPGIIGPVLGAVALMASTAWFLAWAGSYLLAGVLLGRWWFIGGALWCVFQAVAWWVRARRLQRER